MRCYSINSKLQNNQQKLKYQRRGLRAVKANILLIRVLSIITNNN